MDIEKFLMNCKINYPEYSSYSIVKVNSINEKFLNQRIYHFDQIINNTKDINKFLSEIYYQLPVGCKIIINYNEQSFVNFFSIISISQFIFKRVLPKIPLINILANNTWYKANKSISRAEMLGRLVFNGFEPIYDETIGKKSFVFCKKKEKITTNSNPSFYPIIKLRRVGYKGNIFLMYKFRSMYPYSEFIQRNVYESNKLSNSGKLKNDFRVTEYGKFFRKYWIDELPQIINLLKGDLKLVGIRAMSEHYFSLYPDDYKKLYYNVRPGFFSPLYDDITFEGIVKTEKKYLEEYLKNPILTDVKYFFKIISEIIKGKRSS